MDLNGVWASVCFPSFLPGFVGQRISLAPSDPDLGMAAMRAWNDWMLEEWCGRDPNRMIPMQLPWLRDPEVAAAEVRRNAERGFKAVTFSESPDKLGLPSIHTGYWDPFLAACEETETVVCLHVGSSSTSPSTTEDAPPEVIAVLFFAYGMYAAVDWLYSRIPVRFPDIKICMSEGGIGWVAALMDRLDHCFDYQMGYLHTWEGVDAAAGGGAAAQLLVVRARRRERLGDARPHRRRPHRRGERLPARRLDVARHAAPAAQAPRRHARRRGAEGLPRERGGALPAPTPGLNEPRWVQPYEFVAVTSAVGRPNVEVNGASTSRDEFRRTPPLLARRARS